MQKRHTDRYRYFREEAATTEKYFIPYLSEFMDVGDISVLEVGCGEGGNLLPFARRGCRVVGVDLSEQRVRQAESFFSRECAAGTFVCDDVMHYRGDGRLFDLIVCHDVVEHIPEKGKMLLALKRLLAPGGRLFVAFPAWQMPFGGHQQICRSRVLSHLPFFHLLPAPLYRLVLKAGGEEDYRIRELLDIKSTRLPIELFEKILRTLPLEVIDRRFYLINPHYEAKFGLKPRLLPHLMATVPYLRDFFSTSCFYLLRGK